MADMERLAAHVVARRVQLGFPSREALANHAQLSVRTLADIETGRRSSYHASTIAALEHALGWEVGSVGQVVDGYEPTATTLPAGDDASISLVAGSDLPPATKKHVTEILRQDRAAADSRRMDLARALIAAFASGATAE